MTRQQQLQNYIRALEMMYEAYSRLESDGQDVSFFDLIFGIDGRVLENEPIGFILNPNGSITFVQPVGVKL